MRERITRRQFGAATLGSAMVLLPIRSRLLSTHTSMCGSRIRDTLRRPTANKPDRDATPETLLELMQDAGVDRTVIIQVIHYTWDNRYLADVLKQYPKKFRGVARVNPEDPAAPDHLSKLTQEQGFHGVRISPAANASGDWIRGPLMPPLMETLP